MTPAHDEGSSARPRSQRSLAQLAVVWLGPLAVAAVAMVAAARFPLVSALLLAMGIGVVVANTVGRRPHARPALQGTERAAKHLLRAGIVLLGLRIAVSDLGAIGWRGVAVVVATVAVTFAATMWLGARLGLDRGLTTMVAAGFSICGAAAVATVSEQVHAKQRDVGVALALVTVMGTVMIGVVPWLSSVLGLSEQDAAVWAGAAIHEVAQVVAAGSLLGAGALATATSVKLARVALLAPVTAVVGRMAIGSRGRAGVPWFVTGFLVAVVVRSLGVFPLVVVEVALTVSTLLLAAGMFGLGLAIRATELWPLPGRAIALASSATAVAAALPLAILLI